MGETYYEQEQQLHEYLLFHYGEREALLPWSFGPEQALEFPRRCVHELVDLGSLSSEGRALEVGCAVGRASFELSALGLTVLGVDRSERFIAAAERLRREGRLAYRIRESGAVEREAEARLPAGAEPRRVAFRVADALDLPQDFGRFELVMACNLICRLPRPRVFLERLSALVVPGGQLVLTTPHTWLEQFTPPAEWLAPEGEAGDRPVALERLLAPAFELEERRDLPFLIREHRRKFQWSVAEGTRWRRRGEA